MTLPAREGSRSASVKLHGQRWRGAVALATLPANRKNGNKQGNGSWTWMYSSHIFSHLVPPPVFLILLKVFEMECSYATRRTVCCRTRFLISTWSLKCPRLVPIPVRVVIWESAEATTQTKTTASFVPNALFPLPLLTAPPPWCLLLYICLTLSLLSVLTSACSSSSVWKTYELSWPPANSTSGSTQRTSSMPQSYTMCRTSER